RSRTLDALEPGATAYMNPQRLAALGLSAGDVVTVRSRRGAVSLSARADEGVPAEAVFIPFCYYEAAANMLTNPKLDPFGKIPEFKYCAVRVEAGGELAEGLSFGGGVLEGTL
ncbi:MAG: molybdopterin dinucleotide binding domain-containing protein, partial [Gammaproteobacteria bacterium]